ncbi:response regulator [Halospeciosus flavus]|uniref:Response regulator n=1 Tax=Halospeciosus flavus TaxID=3032283 RepID=A0ABD5Z0T3_9EURY|nr:response regulator [Halospeciosus flavus]
MTPPHDADPDTGGVSVTDGEGAPVPDTTEYRVLVVDDEVAFARSVALWLDEEGFETIVATDGDEAVEQYGPHVDVVLLDRKMPGRTGEEALEAIREQEGNARVAMLTALEPDWDIVDAEFDLYLEKPVDREDVVEAVDRLLVRATYARELQALFAIGTKLGELRSQYPESELADDERFQRLEDEFDRVRAAAEPHVGDLDPDELAAYMQIVDESEYTDVDTT